MSKKGRYIEHPEYTEISGGLFFSEEVKNREEEIEKLRIKFAAPIPTPTPPPPTPSFSSMSEREIIRYYDSISIEF